MNITKLIAKLLFNIRICYTPYLLAGLMGFLALSCESKKEITKEDLVGKKFHLDNISSLKDPDKQFPEELLEKMGIEFTKDTATFYGMMITKGTWEINGDTLQISKTTRGGKVVDKKILIQKYNGKELVLLKEKKEKTMRYAFSLKK